MIPQSLKGEKKDCYRKKNYETNNNLGSYTVFRSQTLAQKKSHPCFHSKLIQPTFGFFNPESRPKLNSIGYLTFKSTFKA